MQHHAAITTVAAERIAEELRKLLQATHSHGFRLMHDTGLLPHVLPGNRARLVGVDNKASNAA